MSSAKRQSFATNTIPTFLQEKLVDLNHPQDRIVKFMAYLMGALAMVSIVSKEAPVRPVDPDDEIFLLCAIDAQADYLVTDDTDLLILRSSYSALVIGCWSDLLIPLGG